MLRIVGQGVTGILSAALAGIFSTSYHAMALISPLLGIFTAYVVPTVAMLVSTATFFAAITTSWKNWKEGKLGNDVHKFMGKYLPFTKKRKSKSKDNVDI